MKKLKTTICILLTSIGFVAINAQIVKKQLTNQDVIIQDIKKAEAALKERYTEPRVKNCILTLLDTKTGKRIDFSSLESQISAVLYMKISAEYKLINCVPVSSGTSTTPTMLKVSGNTLKDGCGNTVVLRGVNIDVEKAWWDNNNNWQKNLTILTEISSTGANTVRISWWGSSTNGAASAYTIDKLEAYLLKCKELKLVPVLELHDVTCSNDYTAFENKIMSFWLRQDVKTLLQKYQNYLIINFANEFGMVEWAADDQAGRAAAKTQFINHYKQAITRMRANGYTCPLMIDAPECGSNDQVLLDSCTEIFNADSLANTLFSVHAYWLKYENTLTTINTQIAAMKNSGHCFILGEVANYQAGENGEQCVYDIDKNGVSVMETILNATKTNTIGWIAWEWYNDSCPNRNITTNGLLNTITPQGTKILNNPQFGISKNTNSKACTN